MNHLDDRYPVHLKSKLEFVACNAPYTITIFSEVTSTFLVASSVALSFEIQVVVYISHVLHTHTHTHICNPNSNSNTLKSDFPPEGSHEPNFIRRKYNYS